MRTTGVALALCLGLALGAGRATASEISAIEVLQPLNLENYVGLSRVTCTTFNYGDWGVVAVAMTCDSNAVLGDGGVVENRNIAFESGLKLHVIYNHDQEPPLFGDTLRVELDARSAIDVDDFADTTILKATIQCILVNAAQCEKARFADVRVEGPERLRRFGGVFATARYRSGPLRRDFTDHD